MCTPRGGGGSGRVSSAVSVRARTASYAPSHGTTNSACWRDAQQRRKSGQAAAEERRQEDERAVTPLPAATLRGRAVQQATAGRERRWPQRPAALLYVRVAHDTCQGCGSADWLKWPPTWGPNVGEPPHQRMCVTCYMHLANGTFDKERDRLSKCGVDYSAATTMRAAMTAAKVWPRGLRVSVPYVRMHLHTLRRDPARRLPRTPRTACGWRPA
jgi:hypothetical protein